MGHYTSWRCITRAQKESGYHTVFHLISTCIIPFLELMRWYFSLIRPLFTTSTRFIFTCPSDSWKFERSSLSYVLWVMTDSKEGGWCFSLQLQHEWLALLRKGSPRRLLLTSMWILSSTGGSSTMNWNSSLHLGSLVFLMTCNSNVHRIGPWGGYWR